MNIIARMTRVAEQWRMQDQCRIEISIKTFRYAVKFDVRKEKKWVLQK